MILVLELAGESAGSLGRDSRFLFKGCGGTIGYAQGNTWTLPHPSLPDCCAYIEHVDECFTVVSSGEVCIALGSPQSLLVPLQPYPLRGDHAIFIAGIEIRVTLLDNDGLPLRGGSAAPIATRCARPHA